MVRTRNPAVAGLFYPADPRELRRMVAAFLASAKPQGPVPKAIIAPHAGYIYSGPIAASAYARLRPARGTITKVVLLGPAHRVGFEGLALPDADFFLSPLGRVPIDTDAAARIAKLPQVRRLDSAHAAEHSLEVQLPFLQEVLGEFSLLPLVVGDAAPNEVAEVLDIVWGGAETLIVISSDLSHYEDYATAQRLDRATSEAIEHLAPERIGYHDACGRNAVNGLLHAVKRLDLHAHTIDLRNSGDTAGTRDRVVGYGAYVFE